ncbi:taste receptor, type 2, member 13 [Rattus norvegicus]|uniref:Taste receptor type 2 n=1 Tax=Rattus norvegicus TaxID=10116 RepID=Q9JKT6_RAT|nr:taste receptor, type 2, member 13 [Rattus norvegicus]AAF43918.1 candidate taste receptor T2R8 [Rattus norvegicus]|eukprot:NP_076488.1 taste receptor, type 2, member 13 [Rattus norvegicus]
MEPVIHVFATLLIHVEFIFGNLSNGLIVLSNFWDWVVKRKLSTIDKILLTLAISRITLIWEMYACFKIVYGSSSFIFGMKLQILYFAWILSSHFSLWFATALSIFYLLRIANCSWKIFLYLKWRLKQVIVGMLLASLVFLPGILMQRTLEERPYQYGGNTSEDSMETDFAKFTELILFNMTIFSVIPFSLALISFLLLIFSLWKHLQKMQLSSRGHGDPSTKAHRNALRIMVSFLLLYTSYFLSLLISWIAQKHHSKLVDIIGIITELMYPSVHSFILILGNSKLKQTSLWILSHLKCRLKGENILTPSGKPIN